MVRDQYLLFLLGSYYPIVYLTKYFIVTFYIIRTPRESTLVKRS